MSPRYVVLVGACISVVAVRLAHADGDLQPSLVWHQAPCQGEGLYGVAHGRGQFVAVGRGTVLVSEDGQKWSPSDLKVPYSLRAVAYGKGRFVAVGDRDEAGAMLNAALRQRNSGRVPDDKWSLGIADGYDPLADGMATIVSSVDGREWTRHKSRSHASLHDIAFGSGGFVAVGERGTLLVSEDGQEWTSRDGGTKASLNCIAYADGGYVAAGGGMRDSSTVVGLHDPPFVLTSGNGATWIEGEIGGAREFIDVTHGNGLFVGVTSCELDRDANWLSRVATSQDGRRWTKPATVVGGMVKAVTFGNGIFVAVGGAPLDGEAAVFSSSDGSTWTLHEPVASNSLNAVAYGEGVYVAVGGGWHEDAVVITGRHWEADRQNEAAGRGVDRWTEMLRSLEEAKRSGRSSDGDQATETGRHRGRLAARTAAAAQGPTNNGLFAAAGRGYAATVELLLEQGAELDMVSPQGWTPLMLAAQGGHEAVVDLLLAKGADPNAISNDRSATPLCLAAIAGHTGVVKRLLKEGAHVDTKIVGGNTALMLAVFKGHHDTVKGLVANGADVTAKTGDGTTALQIAASKHDIAMMRLLQDMTDKEFFLLAVLHGRTAIVKDLLSRGADPDAKDQDGTPPVIVATVKGDTQIVRLLIAHGAAVNAKGPMGVTALGMAIAANHAEIIKVLREAGARDR